MIGVKEDGCPLPCGQIAKWTYLGSIDGDSRDWAQIECRCCGKFRISGTFVALLDIGNSSRAGEDELNLRRYLSAHTRQASGRGEVIKLDEYNWQGFAKIHQGGTSAQKSKQLLEFIKSVSDHGVEGTDRELCYVIQHRSGLSPLNRQDTASTSSGNVGRPRIRQV